jgi:nucleotide-binding universal stress UspA family protein
MQTILISTDFTDSSANAIRYAAALAGYVKAEKVVLYNTFSAPPVTTTKDISFSYVETDGLRKLSEEELEKGKALLKNLLPPTVAVETLSEYGFIEQRIDDVARQQGAGLIVMSIDNVGTLEDALSGSSAVQVVKHTQVPVLMVPPNAAWQPINDIAWACGYKNLEKSTPVWSLRPLLQATGARLHVVHNDPEHKQTADSLAGSQRQIQEWFTGTEVTFATLEDKDLKEAVNQYVVTHHIDLLIAIPKKHGWLEGLFASSHSKQLAFHAHVPVVCVQAIG